MNNINNIVKTSQFSFFWAMKLLPKARKNAAYTIYAFCHHLEEVTKGELSLAEKKETLKAWCEELDNIFDKKTPQTEIGRKIYKNCMRFNIQKSEFLKLVHSAQSNISKIENIASLEEYKINCRNMTGAQWYIALNVLGVSDDNLLEELATNIGFAIQSTIVLKNVKDDALLGKTFIPKECLAKAEIIATNPKEILTDTKLSIAREELAMQTLKAFEKAEESIKKLDKTNAKLIKGFVSIYKKYFSIMQKRGWEIISPKPQISNLGKLKIVLRSLLS